MWSKIPNALPKVLNLDQNNPNMYVVYDDKGKMCEYNSDNMQSGWMVNIEHVIYYPIRFLALGEGAGLLGCYVTRWQDQDQQFIPYLIISPVYRHHYSNTVIYMQITFIKKSVSKSHIP